MAGNNLTRQDARERAGLLAVESTEVTLDLTVSAETFASTSVIRFTCARPGASTFLDLVAPAVHEVVLNGRSLDVSEVFDGYHVALPGLEADNEVRIVADCAYMRTGEGLHRFVDPVDGEAYLYSQFETSDAMRMYACFDQPDLKTEFTLTVTAPAHWQVVSNMAAAGEPSAVTDDISRWYFPTSPRMSTYITALIAGPYHVVRDSYAGRGGEIPLGLFCRTSLAQFLDADAMFEVTKQGFEFFERTFDYAYPFGKYDQLFVPEFNAGAMENAGAVTFLEDYVFRSKVTDASYERRAETTLHEMAHMWFGDLVTMRWWDDLWLNESFATYMSVLCQTEATRWSGAWTTFANAEKTWAYRQDQLPSTHPISADIVDIEAVQVNFDGITYAKGASVLKQLVAWVGREEFLAGLKVYFKRHAWGNTTLGDLLTVLEDSSGRDLSSWSKEWLETAGVNTLRPAFEVDSDGRFTSFAVNQEGMPDHPTLRSHRLAIGLYDLGPEGLTRRQRVELDISGVSTAVPELIGVRQADVVLVNDDDLAYAKIRLDERSLATVTTSIGAFTDSLPRALCWTAAWDMTRDAEMAARDYLSLVLAGVNSETDIGVVQSLLRQAQLAVERFGNPDRREAELRRLAQACRDLMTGAAGAGDRQLAFTRAFAACARSEEDLTLLAELLDGESTLPGLSVDTELRWTLLRRLVATGRRGDDAIDAELARDDTAAGRRHAAACRAARPTAEAKEWAWTVVVDTDALPNAEQSAVMAGFQQSDQVELLQPYVERYLASVTRLWHERTMEMAAAVVESLFPMLVVEQRTVDLVDEFIAREHPVPALRRLLVEGRDGIARCLRARARDRATS